MPRLLKKGFQKILNIKILKEMFFQSVTQGAQKEKSEYSQQELLVVQMLYLEH